MTSEFDSRQEREQGRERRQEHEPSIAPGMNTHDPLEEEATEEEIGRGESTEVTRLFLDRTPEE
ncbi:hypothetical protein SK3146_02983 [Paenibacillus konkukensis]|uniref:Uncharacterized protein n=1 Tax=Paenibacillus konkukensis TaxID=2020716 RepID=A0ABY4RMV4_9BACL|nr:hypothetical protein [Paenibacillus konkukensis]UQZ83776.1 hypothetical protein SK3146_02983 [Paenibacillus konkukensis]